jgi:hypothetical protein
MYFVIVVVRISTVVHPRRHHVEPSSSVPSGPIFSFEKNFLRMNHLPLPLPELCVGSEAISGPVLLGSGES